MFAPQIMELFATISDTPLFRSLVKANQKPIMANLKKLYMVSVDHYPELNSNLEMIIKNNGEKVSKSQPSKTNGEKKGAADNKLDEISMIKNEIVNRKHIESNIKELERNSNLKKPEIDSKMVEDFESLPGEKFSRDTKNSMKAGISEKLKNTQDKKLKQNEIKQKEKEQQEKEHREKMVSSTHIRPSYKTKERS